MNGQAIGPARNKNVPGKEAKDTAARVPGSRERLLQGVVAVLADVGMSGITHRRVANAAKVSLSSTTYHYQTKQAMVADASQMLFTDYLDSFARVAERHRQGEVSYQSMRQFTGRLALNNAGRLRSSTMAWCEIILDAARSAEGHRLASDWYRGIEAAWALIAASLKDPVSAVGIRNMIDTNVGLAFIILALGLDESSVRALWTNDDPVAAWGLSGDPLVKRLPSRPHGNKAIETRAKIVDATIRLLNAGGTAAVGYRTVAEESGVALTAPAYHFGSIEALLRTAEHALFDASKKRYRETAALHRDMAATADALADMSSVILIKEATEYRLPSTAFYSLWLEAARSAELRNEISISVADQARAWERRLADIPGMPAHHGIFLQALFIGSLVRALSMGAPVSVLMTIRPGFVEALNQQPWPAGI